MTIINVYRITVFVPNDYLAVLKAAIVAIDPLKVGSYEQVMWSTHNVQEAFTPTHQANPTVGNAGEPTSVDTVRLEFCIPRDPLLLNNIIEHAVFVHHPWEVPAIFIDESLMPMK